MSIHIFKAKLQIFLFQFLFFIFLIQLFLKMIKLHLYLAVTCSKLTIETLKQGVKYVQR